MSDETDEQHECPADECDFNSSRVQSVSLHINYCDYVSDSQSYPTEEMLFNELLRLAEKNNGAVSASEMTQFGKYGNNSYIRRFGSWNEALKEAGLQTQVNKEHRIPKEKLLEELQRIAEKTNGTVSGPEMKKFGKYSCYPYIRRFGSWNAALEEAGLDVYEYPTGEDNHNWSGGSDNFGHTSEGKAWRNAVFQRDHYTCQDCGVDSNANIHAHHIKPRSKHPNLKLQIWNGVTLCEACHAARHEGDTCYPMLLSNVSDDELEQREARLKERDMPYSEEVWDEVPFIRESAEPFRK